MKVEGDVIARPLLGNKGAGIHISSSDTHTCTHAVTQWHWQPEKYCHKGLWDQICICHWRITSAGRAKDPSQINAHIDFPGQKLTLQLGWESEDCTGTEILQVLQDPTQISWEQAVCSSLRVGAGRQNKLRVPGFVGISGVTIYWSWLIFITCDRCK